METCSKYALSPAKGIARKYGFTDQQTNDLVKSGILEFDPISEKVNFDLYRYSPEEVRRIAYRREP